MTRLGVAVAGLGVGEQHARAFAGLDECQVTWLIDHDRLKAEALARELGGQPETDLTAALRDPRTSVVSLATYDQDHHDQVCSALRAGKHVFVEKPLCRSREELSAVVREWRASPGWLSCNLVLRAAPLWRWLRDAIAGGELGEVYAFDGDYLYGRLAKITEGWRADVPGYSVMQGGGVHLIDLMSWLTGQRPASVTASGNRIVSRETRFRQPDFVQAAFQFESGLIGRVTANFGCVHVHQHVVRVFGTRATFVYDDRGARLSRHRDGSVAGAQSVDLAAAPVSKGALIPPFIRAISTNRGREEDARREFDVMTMCYSADDAVESGHPESITYL